MGHAVKEEGGVPGVGRFHLVPYGVPEWGHAARMARVGMEVGQPPCAASALVTARVTGWRAVVGCIRWSSWKPMEASRPP